MVDTKGRKRLEARGGVNRNLSRINRHGPLNARDQGAAVRCGATA